MRGGGSTRGFQERRGGLVSGPSGACGFVWVVLGGRGEGLRVVLVGAIGALMNSVFQPRPLVVLGLNVCMGTAAGAEELVEVPYR